MSSAAKFFEFTQKSEIRLVAINVSYLKTLMCRFHLYIFSKILKHVTCYVAKIDCL